MKINSSIVSILFMIALMAFVVSDSAAQALEELRGEVGKIGSFEYKDLMSDNAQSLNFTESCILELRIVIDWHDGGEWTTVSRIPLKHIRLDGMIIRQHTLEEPPGLFLETYEEQIEVREEQEGVTREFKQYQVFIRTEDDDAAVLLTAYMRRIIAECSN